MHCAGLRYFICCLSPKIFTVTQKPERRPLNYHFVAKWLSHVKLLTALMKFTTMKTPILSYKKLNYNNSHQHHQANQCESPNNAVLYNATLASETTHRRDLFLLLVLSIQMVQLLLVLSLIRPYNPVPKPLLPFTKPDSLKNNTLDMCIFAISN